MELLTDQQAAAHLADPAFIREWNRLAQRCPWASCFQRPDFAVTWYRAYAERFQPVLAIDRDASGQLTGLLPLAIDTRGALSVAGEYQAEYQGWLCTPETGEIFMPEAIRLLRLRFPTASLCFCHLPAGTPLGWAATGALAVRCTRRNVRRPILRFGDGSDIQRSLAKSGNKSRLRQLRRLGPVEFAKVTDPAEFGELMRQIADFQNARCLAVRGEEPFAVDPHKFNFHLAMLNTPGLLHVTTLRAGGRLLSAHLNVTRGREAQLGLISHDPLLAHYSPGKLHILFLARMLHEEGFEQLDLTPGGEAYKERFANDADAIDSLEIHPSAARRTIAQTLHLLRQSAKRTLEQRQLAPCEVRRQMNQLRRLRPQRAVASLAGHLRRWVSDRRQTRIYQGSLRRVGGRAMEIRCDTLHDLMALARRSAEGAAFLSDAYARIERGQRFLATVDEGTPANIAWLRRDDAGEGDQSPGGRVVLEVPVQPGGRVMSPAALWALGDYCLFAERVTSLQVVDASNDAATAVSLDSLGLTHVANRHAHRRWGTTTLWYEPLADAPAPAIQKTSADTTPRRPQPMRTLASSSA